MKIFESENYIEFDESHPPQWLSLEKLNQWDKEVVSVCHKYYDDDEKEYYKLQLCTRSSETTFSKELITNLTDDHKNEIVKLGYTLN